MSRPRLTAATSTAGRSNSTLVAAGIFLSRIAGLVREIAIAAFMGAGVATDAFRAALRIPNLLQNLLGEGVLSASFIPVYSQLLEREDDEEARRVAATVAGLLSLVTAVLVVLGVLLARPFTWLITAGALSDEVFEQTVPLVRIVTIGLGFLVLSAWCLGVLNAHRQFFLSYVAPVVWNAAIIAAVVVTGLLGWSKTDIATAMAWGVVIGGLAQFLVQLPSVLQFLPGLRLRVDLSSPAVRDVLTRFGPTLLGRGVVQLSVYIDLLLAAFLAVGAISTLGFAQVLYLLPISLFAMSVAAAELPHMSQIANDRPALIARATMGLRRIAFFVLFVAAAYAALGDLIVGSLYESIAGAVFGRSALSKDFQTAIWFVLAAQALGLAAVSCSRLAQNTLYAIGDTKGPAKVAAVRVVIAAVVGLLAAFQFDRIIVEGGAILDPSSLFGLRGPLPRSTREIDGVVRLGAVGLAIGSAVASWVELLLLQRLLRRHLPAMPSMGGIIWTFVPAAAFAFLGAATLKLLVGSLPVLVSTIITVGLSGFLYTVICFRQGHLEAQLVLGPIRRLLYRDR